MMRVPGADGGGAGVILAAGEVRINQDWQSSTQRRARQNPNIAASTKNEKYPCRTASPWCAIRAGMIPELFHLVYGGGAGIFGMPDR